MNEGEPQSLKIVPHVDTCPSQMRIYSSEERDGGQILFVELRTVSEGSECIVRSNSDQQDSPIIFEIVTPLTPQGNGISGIATLKIAPRFIGSRVSIALKGARFLACLTKTKRLGLSRVDEDVNDASFVTLDGLEDTDIWTRQLEYLEAITRVCRFFDIDPEINDALNDEKFFHSIMRLDERIRNSGTEMDGTTTFELSQLASDFTSSIDARKTSHFVADMDWMGSIFGNDVAARIRVIANGIPSVEATENDKWILRIKGTYECFIVKYKEEMKEGMVPPGLPLPTQDKAR